jgi:hypothetical protein
LDNFDEAFSELQASPPNTLLETDSLEHEGEDNVPFYSIVTLANGLTEFRNLHAASIALLHHSRVEFIHHDCSYDY